MVLTRFVSPNLKHKNGKIYILNKFEINKNYNFIHREHIFEFLSTHFGRCRRSKHSIRKSANRKAA